MSDSSLTPDDSGGDPAAFYRQMIAENPDSPLPRFSLAKLYVETGRPAEATELLTFCVAKTPDWAAAWLLLGDAHASLGDVAKARAAYGECRAAAQAQHHQSLVDEVDEKTEALA